MYKSFPYSEYLYEIAETAPDQIGCSIEFNGVPETIGDHKFARCDEIFAATIVDLPAANPTGLFAAKGEEENNEDTTMTPEQVKELGKTIVEGLTPVFQHAFKAKADESIEATPEEKKVAGVLDTDSKEEATRKVTEFRARLDKPFTMKDAMTLFRFTGNPPATANLEGGKNGNDKGSKHDQFEQLIDTVIEDGKAKSRGRAILLARKRDGKLYNAWMAKRQKDAAKIAEGEE
jgi:hypothetical protein